MSTLLHGNTQRAHHEYLAARAHYARLLGVDPLALTYTPEDEKLYPWKVRIFRRARFFCGDAGPMMIFLGAFVISIVLTVVYLISGAQDEGWGGLLLGLTALAVIGTGLGVLFSKVGRVVVRDVDHAIQWGTETHGRFMDDLLDNLADHGLDVIEERPNYQFITNQGVITLVMHGDELTYLLNGKMVQQPYQDLYTA